MLAARRGNRDRAPHSQGRRRSIGAVEAIQRVYFTHGSCSEQCWVNHLTDLRQLDPTSRNFGQTPFDIGQCRRDCPNFRAIEDRLPDILAFLKSKETDATDLAAARANAKQAASPKAAYTSADLQHDLDKQFGNNAVARGREVFAATCARCHSSIAETPENTFKNRDFTALNADGMRADWMGSDRATLATEVGTNRCRALHSNHMNGHIWQEYGSETLRAQPPDPNIKEPHEGGRGSYRNISLLSVWAHAPFMHNNAIGPELCGQPANKTNQFYRSPYVDENKKTLEADKARRAGRTTQVSRAVSSSMSRRWRNCLPRPTNSKLARFDKEFECAWAAYLGWAEEKQVLGFTLVLPAGTVSARWRAFSTRLSSTT